ncbi:MAG TPA: ParB/RepB/Spo0J family partition protein [Candidatus Kapabacteria bacterium]|nr:ParB/RepB/Spo0J family partition protein [Candidatus Kapabacteria bacterium]
MSKTRSVLGKGLSALIPGARADEPYTGIELDESPEAIRVRHEPHVAAIEIARVAPNPLQPRKEFVRESLAELTESIREHGIIQPITVRKVAGDKFELISGERRVRAAIEAGLTYIPAYIIEVEGDRKMLELAIVENVQRVELNPIDEAEAYDRLIVDCGLTQEEVASRISKDRTTVANAIRLLKLPERIKDSLRAGVLGVGHAKAILGIADAARQNALWDEAVRKHYPVRKLEELARNGTAKVRSNSKAAPKNGAESSEIETSTDIRSIESGFQHVLGTQVKVRMKADDTGEIAIQFYSQEEFERLQELLGSIEQT